MITTAPVIGLPARMDPGKDRQYLSRHYADAVQAAGGTPVILPLLEDPGSLRPMVDRLDGVLLTGSASDVDPARYGAPRKPECGPVQPLRDTTDFFLLEAAFGRKIPVMAICFGLQSLNVFLGGSLLQDIPSAMRTEIRHSNPRSRGRPSHPVEIEPSSILAPLSTSLRPMVNSTHHQAVDRIADGLRVIARAPDGIVEAMTGVDSESWILAVQWHPEKSASFDEFSKNIFNLYVARCRAESSR
jgi:putative glutamine amidotransferase